MKKSLKQDQLKERINLQQTTILCITMDWPRWKLVKEMTLMQNVRSNHQIPAPADKLKGKIVDVVGTGYKLGEKLYVTLR